MNRPDTRYVKTADGVHIAYQVVGTGPTDLVFVPGFVVSIDHLWEWPQAAAFARRLASFSRLIVFDRRGTGLSDHQIAGHQLSLEARMDDIRAVMDASESPRATVLGFEDGFKPVALFAATYPDRSAALIALGAGPRSRWAPDYPWGWSGSDWDTYLRKVDEEWPTAAFAESEGREVWPDVGEDPQWFRHYENFLRRSTSPGDAVSLLRIDSDTDIRDLLPAIRVPTLVLHRTGDRMEHVGGARYMAQQIPGATFAELPGGNHGWVSPDQDEVLDEIEHFVRQLRAEEAEFERVLATVLFTDMVASTERAAREGDAAWRELVERHHAIVRGVLARYRGTEVDTAGDGFFATFDGPARAVRCGGAIVETVRSLGLAVRVGVHTGEVEAIDGKVGGIAVNIGARVATLAEPDEVLVSSTVKDLVAGSGLVFEDRGEHDLKGIPDRWHLFAAVFT